MKKKITLKDGREILLLGTAHVSRASVEEVRETLRDYEPSAVCVELDSAREQAIKQKDEAWQNLDLISVIRKGRLFFLFVQALLANFQRKVAKGNGVEAGDDMKIAVLWAGAQQVPLVLIDRDINVTLRRAWRKSSLWQKVKLLSQILISPLAGDENITEESLENLKREDVLSHLMEDMARSLPAIKSVLIDERDEYLASSLYLALYPKMVAVLGAGHLEGVAKFLSNPTLHAQQAEENVKRLSRVPKAGFLSHLIPWTISFLFVGALAWIFYRSGMEMGLEGLKAWFLTNGMLSALGAILVDAHPLTWLVALVGAPFTSLSPLVGVGMLTALCEAYFRKPRVKDFMTLSEDIGTFKGFFRNRIAHILLVFFATSLGSSIGTFWGLGILASLGTN